MNKTSSPTNYTAERFQPLLQHLDTMENLFEHYAYPTPQHVMDQFMTAVEEAEQCAKDIRSDLLTLASDAGYNWSRTFLRYYDLLWVWNCQRGITELASNWPGQLLSLEQVAEYGIHSKNWMPNIFYAFEAPEPNDSYIAIGSLWWDFKLEVREALQTVASSG